MSARDQTPREPVGISPRVDCVFKAIMGDPAHANLLMDFLNAVIAPDVARTRPPVAPWRFLTGR